MEELKLTGNHLRGSRPILTFSSNFDKDAHWKLLKEMIIQVHFDMQLFIQMTLVTINVGCTSQVLGGTC